MLKMSSQIENIVSAYKTLSKVPSILSARINKSGNKVTSKWSTRNLDKGKSTKFSYDYVLDNKLNVIAKSDFGTDVSTELLSAISPSETLKAIIREEKDSKDAKKQYLEVWRRNQLAHSIDLTALDAHGDVYADGEFGCLDWSQDETALVYVAEKKLFKSEPYYKRQPAKDPAKVEGSGETVVKKDIFLEIMRSSAAVLEDKRTDTETIRKKQAEWRIVQKKLQKKSGSFRDVAQLKGVWKRFKVMAKKVSYSKMAMQAAGEGPQPKIAIPPAINFFQTFCPQDGVILSNTSDHNGVLERAQYPIQIEHQIDETSMEYEQPKEIFGIDEPNIVLEGEEYLYRQDWGEQLVGKHLSVIVLVKLADESVEVLQGLPEGWCPGQVSFAPDGKSVVGVAWETEPRRLGLIFCTNRPSYIFSLTLDGNMTKLSAEGLAVRSPRVSPSGQIVWLQRSSGGPHHAAHSLVLYNSETKQTRVVIPTTNSTTTNGTPFNGVYSQGLPKRCFNGDRVVFSTPQANEVRSYVLSLVDNSLIDISSKTPGSTSILDVNGDLVVAVTSNINTPHQILVARLPPQGQESSISWSKITDPIEVPTSVAEAKVEYLSLEHNNDDAIKTFTAIFVSPKLEGKKLPLIVWAHGGPHSNFVNAYALETALFTMLGFASIQINYRGSTGQGQASVDYSPSRVGKADVEDCKLATDKALKLFEIDAKKLYLFGGSHGGFLVTHLSGQYPDVYRAVVTRNPVIDVSSMANATDIPDWCAVEAGFDFTEAGPLSEDQLLTMRRCSPLAHVHRVVAPTALMLGSGDKRVPHAQGLEYYRRLKANGVKTRVYLYDDNHSLSSPAVEMDNLINSAAWFFEHMD